MNELYNHTKQSFYHSWQMYRVGHNWSNLAAAAGKKSVKKQYKVLWQAASPLFKIDHWASRVIDYTYEQSNSGHCSTQDLPVRQIPVPANFFHKGHWNFGIWCVRTNCFSMTTSIRNGEGKDLPWRKSGEWMLGQWGLWEQGNTLGGGAAGRLL